MIQLINDKKGVETKLNEIQFPFGKLPLNLDQSGAAFPIPLAIGFVACVYLQRNAIRLREEPHKWYKKKYPNRTIFTNQKVALIAPLWIDPIDSKPIQIARFTILVLPFFIFILVCYLIFYYMFLGQGNENQNIVNHFTSESIWIYGGFYVLGFCLFIYGCWNMIIALSHYMYANSNS